MKTKALIAITVILVLAFALPALASKQDAPAPSQSLPNVDCFGGGYGLVNCNLANCDQAANCDPANCDQAANCDPANCDQAANCNPVNCDQVANCDQAANCSNNAACVNQNCFGSLDNL